MGKTRKAAYNHLGLHLRTYIRLYTDSLWAAVIQIYSTCAQITFDKKPSPFGIVVHDRSGALSVTPQHHQPHHPACSIYVTIIIAHASRRDPG